MQIFHKFWENYYFWIRYMKSRWPPPFVKKKIIKFRYFLKDGFPYSKCIFPVPTDLSLNITLLWSICTHKWIRLYWNNNSFFRCTAEEELSMSGWLLEKRWQDLDLPEKGQSCYYMIVNLVVENFIYDWPIGQSARSHIQ